MFDQTECTSYQSRPAKLQLRLHRPDGLLVFLDDRPNDLLVPPGTACRRRLLLELSPHASEFLVTLNVLGTEITILGLQLGILLEDLATRTI